MTAFIARACGKLGLLPSLNLVTGIRIRQHRFKIPIIGGVGMTNVSTSERWMVSLLERLGPFFANNPGAFIDVGVNVGQTLLKLRSVYPEMEYVGFEPNPTCVHYVQRLIELNGFRHTRLVPVGISEQASLVELQFYYDNQADSSASIIEGFRPDQRVVNTRTVPVFPGTLLNEMSTTAFIKTDVEGAELEVLCGLRDTVGRDRPLVATEILPCYSHTNGDRLDRQEKVQEYFRSLNYSCTRVQKTSADGFAGLVRIDEIGIHSDLNDCEYLWLPAEHTDGIMSLMHLASDHN